MAADVMLASADMYLRQSEWSLIQCRDVFIGTEGMAIRNLAHAYQVQARRLYHIAGRLKVRSSQDEETKHRNDQNNSSTMKAALKATPQEDVEAWEKMQEAAKKLEIWPRP